MGNKINARKTCQKVVPVSIIVTMAIVQVLQVNCCAGDVVSGKNNHSTSDPSHYIYQLINDEDVKPSKYERPDHSCEIHNDCDQRDGRCCSEYGYCHSRIRCSIQKMPIRPTIRTTTTERPTTTTSVSMRSIAPAKALTNITNGVSRCGNTGDHCSNDSQCCSDRCFDADHYTKAWTCIEYEHFDVEEEEDLPTQRKYLPPRRKILVYRRYEDDYDYEVKEEE